MMDSLTLGQRIAEQRKKLGLSQEALGDKMNVSRQAISKWESDGAVPEIDKLIALSRLFGVSVGWLLGVEEPPEQRSDELSEAQLKTVEEIVRHYRPEPSPGDGQMKKAVLGAICLVCLASTLALTVLGLRKPNTNTENMISQISSLRQENAQIQARLDDINVRLDSLSRAAENEEKLLTGFDFHLTEVTDTAVFTFRGTPKSYAESQSAALQITRRDGEELLRYDCRWDGSGWLCEVQLSVENGYEYAFLLKDSDAVQHIVLLDGGYYSDLKDSLSPHFELTGPIEVERKLGELWVTWIGGQLWMPELSTAPENLYWEEFSCVLYVDGKETDRRSLLPEESDPYEKHRSFYALSTGGSLMEVPTLYDGMLVEIRLHARLSNGTEWDFPGGKWLIKNGEPAAQSN